jgi:HEAT repeat protein
MPLYIFCPLCNQTYMVGDNAAGQLVQCPNGHVLAVQDSGSTVKQPIQVDVPPRRPYLPEVVQRQEISPVPVVKKQSKGDVARRQSPGKTTRTHPAGPARQEGGSRLVTVGLLLAALLLAGGAGATGWWFGNERGEADKDSPPEETRAKEGMDQGREALNKEVRRLQEQIRQKDEEQTQLQEQIRQKEVARSAAETARKQADALLDKKWRQGENPLALQFAVQGLAKLPLVPPEAIPLLTVALKDARVDVRRNAAAAWSGVKLGAKDGALSALAAAARDTDGVVRALVLLAMWNQGHAAKAVTPTFLAGLEDKELEVRRIAVAALAGLVQEKGVFTALVDLLQDPDLPIRKAAGAGFVQMVALQKEHMAALIKALKSDAAGVRGFAARGLAQLAKKGHDCKEAVPNLTEALGDKDASVRRHAVQALGAIGPAARAAISALARLLTEKREKASAAPQGMSGEKVFDHALRSTAWILLLDARGGVKSCGSGWLAHRGKKLVVTNYHVVQQQREVLVFFPAFRDKELVTKPLHYVQQRGLALEGEVVARDPASDLAIIQLKRDLPAAVRALSIAAKSATPGQKLHSIGASGVDLRTGEGTLWRYSEGKVRQVYRKQIRYGNVNQVVNAYIVESQSPINPGDSGGPVVNDRGELVAVVSGGDFGKRLISFNIDVREVRALLTAYFQAVKEPWLELTIPPAPFVQGDLREAAALALGRVGKDAIEELRKALAQSKDMDVRGFACVALGNIGPDAEKTFPWLILALREKELHDKVVEALVKMGPVLIDKLLKKLDNKKLENAVVRLAAIKVLRQIGHEARNPQVVVTSLLWAYKDPVPEVRQAAKDAVPILKARIEEKQKKKN